jgi:hypothetical protein
LVKHEHVAVQEIIADIGIILRKISSALNDHEQRLQVIEALDLKMDFGSMKVVRRSIENKQTEALHEFIVLCNSLGISDLELTQSLA